MAAVVIEIADAVKDALNAAGLSQTFTAVRAYVVVHGKQDEGDDGLAALHVSVVPAAVISDVGSVVDRTRRHQFDYAIDVGIQRRRDNDNDSMDPLMLLAQEVVDLFRGTQHTLENGVTYRCVGASNDPIFDPRHVVEFGVFTSVVRLTFRLVR